MPLIILVICRCLVDLFKFKDQLGEENGMSIFLVWII